MSKVSRTGIGIGLMLAIGLTLLPFAAQADITRSCRGAYVMVATQVDGVPPRSAMEWSMGDFRGKGRCKKTNPNACREQARRALKQCYEQHWDSRWDRETPQICTSKAVERYGIDDLKTAMEKTVCCSKRSASHDNVKVALYGVTAGDQGCFGKGKARVFKDNKAKLHRIAPEYKMNCPAIRSKLCP